jgi:hypothetical protein
VRWQFKLERESEIEVLVDVALNLEDFPSDLTLVYVVWSKLVRLMCNIGSGSDTCSEWKCTRLASNWDRLGIHQSNMVDDNSPNGV